MRKILANLELVLCAAGLLTIWLVPAIIGNASSHIWKIATITALLIGVIHGLTLWLIRQKQRRARHEVIADIRHMLQDRINNQLAIIIMNSQMANRVQETSILRLQEIKDSAQKVADYVNAISDESLQQWKAKYETVPVKMRPK